MSPHTDPGNACETVVKDRAFSVTIEISDYLQGDPKKPIGWASRPAGALSQAVVGRFYSMDEPIPIKPPSDQLVKPAQYISVSATKINFYFNDAIPNPNNLKILVIWVIYLFPEDQKKRSMLVVDQS